MQLENETSKWNFWSKLHSQRERECEWIMIFHLSQSWYSNILFIYRTITNVNFDCDTQNTDESMSDTDMIRTDSSVASFSNTDSNMSQASSRSSESTRPSSSSSAETNSESNAISKSNAGSNAISNSNAESNSISESHRKRKAKVDENYVLGHTKRMDILTEFITKAPSEVDAYCSSLACTLKKFPEYIQAELKLQINTLVSHKEIDFLRATGSNYYYNNQSVPNTTPTYSYSGYYNNSYNSVNNNQNENPFAQETPSVTQTVIVDSAYGGSSSLTQI